MLRYHADQGPETVFQRFCELDDVLSKENWDDHVRPHFRFMQTLA